jgi:GR25 family glycosyltransferase involved in LPS biosynthesis
VIQCCDFLSSLFLVDVMIQTGAARIAAHYKFTLSHIFDSNPTAQYGIIVEDDMIFSPDFLAFFQHTYKLYERDPTVYCISSWNDNGRFGLVKDANRLLRTEFFIGLGWLASRKQYKSEFEKIWPPTHWDHWMRDPAQRKNRVCVYPELPRNYNIGKIGTHSDHSLFQRYFADIHHNLLPPNKLKYTSIDAMLKESYDAEVGTLIYQATQVLVSFILAFNLQKCEQFCGFIFTLSGSYHARPHQARRPKETANICIVLSSLRAAGQHLGEQNCARIWSVAFNSVYSRQRRWCTTSVVQRTLFAVDCKLFTV